jgi:O-glycosyl hydrolase
MLAEGLSVELWAYDHNTDHPEFPAVVLEGSPFVQAVAWHCYSGGWEVLTAFHERFPKAAQFMTECWTHAEVDSIYTHTTFKQPRHEALFSQTNALVAPAHRQLRGAHSQGESFFELPKFVLGPLMNWASGALAWTLVGSSAYDVSYPGGCAECSGLVQVDMARGTFELTQDFFSMGQFSKYIHR